jgi:putative redox protein
MAVEIHVAYQGELHCVATHGPSRAQMATDAPADNMGKGATFSPTDLVATSLGACILTTMGIVAQRHDIDMTGASVKVEKHMIADPDRRIAALPAVVTFPAAIAAKITPQQRTLLERTAHGCPVQRSLDARVDRPIRFVWGS